MPAAQENGKEPARIFSVGTSEYNCTRYFLWAVTPNRALARSYLIPVGMV